MNNRDGEAHSALSSEHDISLPSSAISAAPPANGRGARRMFAEHGERPDQARPEGD
jgi:hypothetical protein